MKLTILEPSGVGKRVNARVPFMAHAEAAGRHTAVASGIGNQVASEPGLEQALADVREVRAAVAQDPWRNAARLMEALTEQGVAVAKAESGADAARLISQFAHERRIITNNSAAVKEIRQDLLAEGLLPQTDYPGREVPASAATISRGWQLPREPGEVGWGTFRERRPTPSFGGRNLLAATALLGVSAASAEGSFLWVQHFENISRALDQADRLILLVPLDKVAGDEDSTGLQVRVAAAHGWAARILDSPTVPSPGRRGEVWSDLPDSTGGRELLVILLDNGRSAWAGTELEELLQCLSCRACRQNCPTYRYFHGELDMSPVEYLRYYHQGLHDDLSLCVGCGNCARSCPVDIDIPGLIARARKDVPRAHPIRDYAVSNPGLIGRVGMSLFRGSSGGRPAGLAAEVVTGIHRDVRMPAYPKQTFREWFSERAVGTRERAVVFFAGCFVNFNDLEQGTSTVRLLERAGFQVLAPEVDCCEIPKLQSGDWKHSRGSAQRNAEALLEAVESRDGVDAIVTGCPSCARALTEFYPELIGEPGARIAEKVEDLFHFLLRNGLGAPRGDAGMQSALPQYGPARRPPLDVVYHTPCHYPGVDPSLSVIDLLRVLGASVEELDRGCCGMSGSFGLKARYHERSMEVGADLFDRLGEEREDRVITTNCGACKLQIEQGTGRRVVHPALLIDRFTRGG